MKVISLIVLTTLIVTSIAIMNDKIKELEKTKESFVIGILPYIILILFLIIPLAYIITN